MHHSLSLFFAFALAFVVSCASSDDTAQPDVPSDGACQGPFVETKSEDTCDSLDESWDVRSNVASVEACFALCSQSAFCRRDASVDYHPGKHSCILDSSCAPTELGYVSYSAKGDCELEQCWSSKAAPASPCDDSDEPSSYFEADSLEECIMECEIYPKDCDGEIQFNQATGACVIAPQKCDYKGFERLEYEEVSCGDAG